MAAHAPEAEGSGTWGSREAAAEWRRGAAARLAALGPATEMMLDLAGVKTGSRVLDVGAGTGDSALMAARRVSPTGHVLATDISASMLEIAARGRAEALDEPGPGTADPSEVRCLTCDLVTGR